MNLHMVNDKMYCIYLYIGYFTVSCIDLNHTGQLVLSLVLS